MGPIQIFLLGFEDFQNTGRIADELVALSDAGTIRVVDARFLLKESNDEALAARMSDLDDSEREELRAAAGALVGLGAGAVLGGEDGAAAGMVLGADGALGVGELGLSDAQLGELAAELPVGDALLLLVIENVWATGLAHAVRRAVWSRRSSTTCRPRAWSPSAQCSASKSPSMTERPDPRGQCSVMRRR